MSQPAPTLEDIARQLDTGEITSRQLVEDCLARIADPDGEGALTYISVDTVGARAVANAMDALRKAGAAPSRFAGIPISIKDLFDIKGQVTRAGSKVLSDRPPAAEDATAVARLRQAGFVVMGRTNMTEFAYSGVGLNPHYGTPRGVWNRTQGHIPGGSSSGAAVSVADHMAHVGLGTDTGGSCRIPAAFNRLVGYKPSAQRVPTKGAVPLSWTLDSIGSMARSVSCCANVDSILAGEPEHDLSGSLEGVRFASPTNYVWDGSEAAVRDAFREACQRLERAGADIVELDVPELSRIPQMSAKASFTAAESFAWHRALLAERGADYDPRVKVRIEVGSAQLAADYVDLLHARQRFIADVRHRLAGFDAIVCPTTPITPPRLSDFTTYAEFGRLNGLCLRNPTVFNWLDGCSISLPIGSADVAPVGLMMSAFNGQDGTLFKLAAAAERALA